ncbi:hypothetical protein JW752_01095 [Candidatus Peregrinibacteria bacterium]|nr:hypothetical protein [Candidatus Peregrinibacteria bacterium]
MRSKSEHTCPCCNNPEVVEKILSSKTIPSVLCEGVVRIADSQGNYRFSQLKERADRLNGIRTPEQRAAELIEEMRRQLGYTSSARGFASGA